MMSLIDTIVVTQLDLLEARISLVTHGFEKSGLTKKEKKHMLVELISVMADTSGIIGNAYNKN